LFNNHKLKFCNFNTNGAKRNLNFIQVLIMRNDFLFLCETWLLDYESSTFLNTLSSSHLVLHKSDMIITPTKGRPYGGRAFIVNKKFDIGNFEFLNKHVAYISLKVITIMFSRLLLLTYHLIIALVSIFLNSCRVFRSYRNYIFSSQSKSIMSS
jgi:hypothetical protein